MSVKRRKWKTKDGTEHEAWVVRYSTNDRYGEDNTGERKRSIKTFATRKEADVFASTVRLDVLANTHVPASRSITVQEAGKLWFENIKGKRSAGTVENIES